MADLTWCDENCKHLLSLSAIFEKTQAERKNGFSQIISEMVVMNPAATEKMEMQFDFSIIAWR